MRSKYKTLLFLLAGHLTLASCSKSFIDSVVPANGDITSNLIFTSQVGVDNAMTGIYEIMRDYITPNGQANMYGWKTAQLNFDMRGNDLIAQPANWYSFENNWVDDDFGRVATSNRTLQMWNLCYKVINNANTIIANVPSAPIGQADQDADIAEARALRGWAYFNLARIYQFTYARDTTAPGVPIYTTPSDGSTSGNPRSPLNAVYQLIVSDLESASATLTTTRVDKYRINKNVAQGILAEVYQEMAMADPTLWAKAESNAASATAGFSLMPNAATNGYADGFNTVTNGEWIWGLQFNASQSYGFASFFGFIEPDSTAKPNFRYNDIYVNTTFVNLFSSTDMRRLFIENQAAIGSSTPWVQWQTMKFRDNSTVSGDYVMMRAAEMYLIQAEAQAQQGELATAETTLYALQHERDTAATMITTPNKDSLLYYIRVERRKELYGEMGVEYFDLKRYQLSMIRDGVQWSTITVPAGDNRWRWQIPQSEMDGNKSLTAADQNPL
ncbi:MAG: RagB/SusD family nutrient uptake outer membrane protein [Puia sp.]|nr:RagB/SusD family nutrient uptake outer membrane protein [Puia sp.]